ncbi:MAG TPA: efflux RND transporter permease subunit [Actinomycetota bacterium]|nr:efflux RND transporter permease subunit [Actinomycetota bacterium]
MRWIVGTSLKYRFIVLAVAGSMMFLGAGQLQDMPVDVFPEFAPPKVEIQTISWGLNSAEVESLITVPLEEALNGVPGLDVIRSKSVPDLSSVVLYFKPGSDVLEARQLVAERVAAVTPSLPTWASPPVMIQPLSATSRVMKIGLTSDEVSLTDMSTIAYWTIRARLLRVPGVANVPIWGERLPQRHVQVDPALLAEHGVTLSQVMKATADALDAGLLQFSDGAVIGTGGFLETSNQRLTVRHVLPILSPSELSKVVVVERKDETILLRDVATVEQTQQSLIGDAVINDGPGLMLIVEKLPWGNTLEITEGVEAALEELAPGLPGITIDSSIFRPATFVEVAIDNLSNSLLLGVLLMVVVLFLFLFDWRSALISAVTIPLSLTAAGLVLYWRGTTINTMVLAGLVIALGAVVDDAIVDVENIVRRLRLHRRSSDDRTIATTARVVFDASLEVRGAVVYASLIEALALLPIFFLTGLTGSFFRPLAMSYALAVLVSLVVALIWTPAMALILLRKAPLDRRESPVVRGLQRGYDRLLTPIIRTPRPAYVTVGALMVAGALVVPALGQSLLPDFKERDFLMHWLTPPGTSLTEEVRVSTLANRELLTIPGVRNAGSHIGQAFLMDEVVGVDFGENWISVDPAVDYDQTVARIKEVVNGYPGLYRDVLTYLRERIKEVLTGASETVVVRLFGPDLEVLRTKADEVVEILAKTDGVIDAHVDLDVDVPQAQIAVDLAAAREYGIKPGDVRRATATMLASEEVGDIFVGGKAYDVHVWTTPESRDSLNDIQVLPIDIPGGGQVLLGEIADVSMVPIPNVIHHESQSRSLDVGANLDGTRDLGSVVSEIGQGLEDVEFPREYHAEMLGEFAERQAAQRRLQTFAVITVIGIFLILMTSLGNVRLATLAFVTMPMAMVGGVLAAYFSDGVISLGSLVGFFTVLGIVARNGIMMISHYQYLEEYEGEIFGPELVARGSRERLAPILMTALTTGLALVPLVISGNVPGQEIEYPMAFVILGGLITSTLLNLFVVPSLYLRFGKSRRDAARVAASG